MELDILKRGYDQNEDIKEQRMPSLDTCHICRVEGRLDKKMGAPRVPDNLDQSRPFQKARSDAAGA